MIMRYEGKHKCSYGAERAVEVQASSHSGIENLDHVRLHKNLILKLYSRLLHFLSFFLSFFLLLLLHFSLVNTPFYYESDLTIFGNILSFF